MIFDSRADPLARVAGLRLPRPPLSARVALVWVASCERPPGCRCRLLRLGFAVRLGGAPRAAKAVCPTVWRAPSVDGASTRPRLFGAVRAGLGLRWRFLSRRVGSLAVTSAAPSVPPLAAPTPRGLNTKRLPPMDPRPLSGPWPPPPSSLAAGSGCDMHFTRSLHAPGLEAHRGSIRCAPRPHAVHRLLQSRDSVSTPPNRPDPGVDHGRANSHRATSRRSDPPVAGGMVRGRTPFGRALAPASATARLGRLTPTLSLRGHLPSSIPARCDVDIAPCALR